VSAPIYTDPYRVGAKFLGVRETPGIVHNPTIVSMLHLVDKNINDDETPWCSAFVIFCCFVLGVPHSQSLRARSWLTVGRAVLLDEARPGFDVVVLTRGADAPGPEVIAAPGHVGFFAAYNRANRTVRVLGGNQGNQVSYADFPVDRVLGVRRVA
jgi:uncharacterized protein (TIGR02594 family)